MRTAIEAAGRGALIAFTAAEHDATLVSLRPRAAATHKAADVQIEQLLG
jgi:hypothetical protein